jgi:ring-1,2-phenylacetyl-CoA epoxidase subunit PaaC
VSGPPAACPDPRVVYALRLADDALVLAQQLTLWVSRAPQIEEDIAVGNLALDLLGQARVLYRYAAARHPDQPGEDDFAYLRDARAFTNALLVEQPDRDFASAVLRQLLFSCYQRQLYRGLAGSADGDLAGIALAAAPEVAYHADHARLWTLRLGDGTPESHRRAQRAVDELWPYTAELFAADPVTTELAAAGIAPDPAELAEPWGAEVSATLTEATLEVPAGEWWPTGGRAGRHGEAFGYLLAEMQSLARAHPGAAW